MKKVVLFLFLITLAVASYGQEVVQPQPMQNGIVRKGDRYTVAGVTYYNSTAFRGYLKNNNPDLFAQYNKGYKLGMAGWGLLAFGTIIGSTSALWLPTQLAEATIPIAAIGGSVMIAGISLLGVGYHKMHKSVDVYNVSLQPVPQTYWSIHVSGNGIGVAYNF